MARKIKHVFGNRIELRIPLTEREVSVSDGSVSTRDTILVPTVRISVRLSKGYGSYNYDVPATVSENVVVMVDNGTIPVGTWSIEVVGSYADQPFRYKRDIVLEVVDATEDGGDYANDEVDVLAYYPVVNGRSSAVVITDDAVIVEVGGRIGADDDEDEAATVYNDYGEGSVELGDDAVTIYI